jgi:pimeloyl-ACP methyl ester carboxylesterase
MREVELSAGTIEYEDTGDDGPVLVLLHGLMMDASLWDEVVADLSADHRCVVPTLPLGAHRRALRAGADLSLPGIARLAAEFLDRLDLRDVTLVGNDTGGALVQLTPCGYCGPRPPTPASCWRWPNACRTSTAPLSSSGPAGTG